MIKKILYIISVLAVLAISTMILLNGLGLVDYRLNDIISYVSRFLIVLLIILFIMAIVNVRKSNDEDEPSKAKLNVARPAPAVPTHQPVQTSLSARQSPIAHQHPKRPVSLQPASTSDHHQTPHNTLAPQRHAQPASTHASLAQERQQAKQTPHPAASQSRMPHTQSNGTTGHVRKRRVVGMDVVAPTPRKDKK